MSGSERAVDLVARLWARGHATNVLVETEKTEHTTYLRATSTPLITESRSYGNHRRPLAA